MQLFCGSPRSLAVHFLSSWRKNFGLRLAEALPGAARPSDRDVGRNERRRPWFGQEPRSKNEEFEELGQFWSIPVCGKSALVASGRELPFSSAATCLPSEGGSSGEKRTWAVHGIFSLPQSESLASRGFGKRWAANICPPSPPS